MKRIFLLYGEVGTGKTTFVKNFLRLDEVSSPTFSICNHYEHKELGIVKHFDLYRLENISMSLFYDALFEADLIFIEWAEKCPEFLNYQKEIVKMFF
jgi:tRNA threonylcarbamoyladenosine biosynthesis protein TsaE